MVKCPFFLCDDVEKPKQNLVSFSIEDSYLYVYYGGCFFFCPFFITLHYIAMIFSYFEVSSGKLPAITTLKEHMSSM